MLTPGVVALAYGISEAGGSGGFGDTRAWLPMAVGTFLIASFSVYSLRTRRTPLIDVRLFRSRGFALASLITFVSGFSTFAGMFLLPMFYQVVRGNSALETGVLLIPQGLGTITFLLASGWLSKRVDSRLIVGSGILLTMVGLLPFVTADASSNAILLLVGQFVRGVGVGACLQPVMTVAFASLPRAEVPRASAAFSVVQRVGAPFGVTVVAVLLQGYLTDAGTDATLIADAFGNSFWWVLGFSAVPLALAALLPPPIPAQIPAEPTTEDPTPANPNPADLSAQPTPEAPRLRR
jgi:MFS family permease